MKKQTIKTFGIMIVLGFVSMAHGQQPKRIVEHHTIVEHYFSIPYTTDFKRLSDLDYNKMEVENKKIHTKIEIDQNNLLTITKSYLNGERYENDYENMISKSISHRGETILFDDRDQVLYRYQSSNNDVLLHPLSEEEIRTYGDFSAPFLMPYPQMSTYFRNNGYHVQYIPNRQTLIAVNREVEIMIDYRNYLYEMRCFHLNNFYYSKTFQYQKWNNYLIPYIEINMIQDSLMDGSPFIKNQMIKYVDYSIIDENGNTLVEYKNKDIEGYKNHTIEPYTVIGQRELELKVYPNPTSDQFAIEFPFFMEESISIEISNTHGKVVYKDQSNNNEKLTIDISSFPNGIYLITCICDGITKTSKIVKQ